jgi:hypothetical protein
LTARAEAPPPSEYLRMYQTALKVLIARAGGNVTITLADAEGVRGDALVFDASDGAINLKVVEND